MNTFIERAKHFFSMIGYIFVTAYKVLKDRRTWITVGILLAFYLWGWFNANYIIPPVKEWNIIKPRYTSIKYATVVPLVKAKEVKPVVVAKTEEEIVKGAKYGEELWNIYMLESTRGKNDGCRKNGDGWGGFGVMGANGVQCYPTFEKAVERASYWYERVRKGNTLDEALCIWNLGVKSPQCKYSQTYHSL